MPSAATTYPPPGPLGATDASRWHLDSSDEGRVKWTYDRTEVRDAGPQSDETKYWLGLDLGLSALPDPEGNPLNSARNGFEFYKKLQSSDGHWSPHVPHPRLRNYHVYNPNPDPHEWAVEVTRYLANIQRNGGEADRGWGIHIEGSSTVLGTALNYVACRLLGVDPDVPMMVAARTTLHKLGGATGIPSWGKFWLSLLSVYSWSGFNSVPPELWLLPTVAPIHPSKWWIHTRQVYIPMGYLYGKRFTCADAQVLEALRGELYVESYESIRWEGCRNKCAEGDLYAPRNFVANGLFKLLGVYECVRPEFIRNAGINRAYDLVVMEDENTNYQSVGPVSCTMNMIIRWDRDGPESDAFRAHQKVLQDFMWMSRDGMMVTGTNGSQLWDLSFIGQALVETGLAEDKVNRDSVVKALGWLDRCQIRDNPKFYGAAFRHTSKGAWPFSTKEQSYTVSDCTAEALKAVLYLQNHLDYTPNLVSKERLCDAVDVILTMQNPNGGFASYELIRGYQWLEWLNPAEVFGEIIIEYSYPECTTACLTALSIFNSMYPDYRRDDIARVRKGAISFIHNSQKPDGSWFGSWAICFTYATMFALESLSLNNETFETSERVRRACDFLLKRQMEDGGWGESYKSCETGTYVHHVKSQVVQTAYVVMGLLAAKCPDHDAIVRGCRLIMSRQKSNGEWPQESIEGIFNRSTAISYPNYKFAWTIWALGKAYKQLPDVKW